MQIRQQEVIAVIWLHRAPCIYKRGFWLTFQCQYICWRIGKWAPEMFKLYILSATLDEASVISENMLDIYDKG